MMYDRNTQKFIFENWRCQVECQEFSGAVRSGDINGGLTVE